MVFCLSLGVGYAVQLCILELKKNFLGMGSLVVCTGADKTCEKDVLKDTSKIFRSKLVLKTVIFKKKLTLFNT